MIDVRAARDGDLEALTEIYNHYVINTHVTFDVEPFTVDERRDGWLAHYAETGPHRVLVAVDGETVLGYATSGRFREKPAYASSVECTVYCRVDTIGLGVGSALYLALFDALTGEDVHRAYAGVALPNEASLALHRRFGFTEIGTFREVGRKHGRYWDVTWLERPL